MRLRGFVLLEFVFGIVVLGVISVTCAKLLLHFKSQEIRTHHLTTLHITLQNTLLQISHLTQNAQNLSFGNGILHFDSPDLPALWQGTHLGTRPSPFDAPLKAHTIALRQGGLYLDDAFLLDGVEVFELRALGRDSLLHLCKVGVCLQKVRLEY